jgi:heterotetrameric sarcosine oxidase gamma subunit
MQKECVTVLDSTFLRSPFTGHHAVSQPDRQGQVQVQLNAHVLPSVTLISTWVRGEAKLLATLKHALQVAIPQSTGKTVSCSLGLLMRTGPQELVLVGTRDEDIQTALRAHIVADVGSVTDLSQARCRIHVSGAKAQEALGKLFALDFRQAAFAVNDIALTGHHHVPCTVHRLGDQSFDLYVFSTYAFGQLESLIDAAREFGVELSLN